MAEPPFGKPELAAEAQRRLRLARIASGLAGTSVHVHAAGDDADHDVVIIVSPADPGTADQIRALLPDMRIRVREGQWHRT